MKRKTIASEFIIEGIGLHRGNKNFLVVKPYHGRGIVFKNPDNGKSVLASLENVISLIRGTVIGCDGFEVSTVEHLLSCFMAFNIDDAEIEIKGDEIPAFDGSNKVLCEVIKKIGTIEKNEDVDFIEIDESFCYLSGESFYKVEKSDDFIIDVTFENTNPVVGFQRLEFKLTQEAYISEIAPARTFAFEYEIDYLKKNGLAKGGSLENAVVIGENSVLNPEGLRFKDEFVRHKILDLLGDLKLLGSRIRNMKITAKRPSHKGNISLAKLIKIRSKYEQSKKNT